MAWSNLRSLGALGSFVSDARRAVHATLRVCFLTLAIRSFTKTSATDAALTTAKNGNFSVIMIASAIRSRANSATGRGSAARSRRLKRARDQ